MRKNSTVNIKQIISCAIMALALAWLTVSIPFVYAQQEKLAAYNIPVDLTPDIEEESNPFTNTTEEKTESGNNTLSEYLHDLHLHVNYSIAAEESKKCHPSDLYFEFHPELISPPPEFALL
ncbi:MAG TPA: hypothetical protein VGD17_10890 [Chitinophagaceae bacterium]